jgi:putative MFS transporter
LIKEEIRILINLTILTKIYFMNSQNNLKQLFSVPVIVAALGYFVDIYDLLLFSIVRISSLKSMGVSDVEMMATGEFLIRVQMAGLLVGGIIWGIMGDKRGRLSVLFGSILLYSLANIANGFAETVTQYAVLRFIAGIGLAGELGAGITLVSETLPTKLRGYGTTLGGFSWFNGCSAGKLHCQNFRLADCLFYWWWIGTYYY